MTDHHDIEDAIAQDPERELELAELVDEARHRALGFYGKVFALLRSKLQEQSPNVRRVTAELLAARSAQEQATVAARLLRIANRDYLRMFDTFCLALGYTEVAAAPTPAKLAACYGVPRETVNAPLNDILELLALPPLPAQRKEESRARIRAARVQSICASRRRTASPKP